MALAPINPTQITPPRVNLIDERSGAISREWYRFFLSLLTATQNNQEDTDFAPDTSSLLATYDAMLATATQASEVTPDGMGANLESSLNNLQNAFGVTPPDLGGTVTSVAASGGTTGLTFTGSPITTSGTLTLGGTLGVANGGTGQTTYTNGQLLIGNTTGNTLAKATLTAGANVSITNGAGSITIAAADAFTGTVTSVSVVSANGLAGTVATATTTPAITLSTTVTGVVKGNGTALSAAAAGTDYVAPGAYTTSGLTMATARLLGRTTAAAGAAQEISVAGGLTLSGGVLTGTSGTVTSVGGTGTVNGITLTGTVSTSGNLTLGGTLSGVSLTTQVSGTLPVGNGGTGATTFTANALLKGNATSAVSASNVSDNGSTVSIGSGIGFSIARTAVTAPAAADGNVFSGTYTPTAFNTTNIAASTPQLAQYLRVGNTVTVSGQIDIDPTATGAAFLGLSLPIASALTSATQLSGVFNCPDADGGGVYADATNDRATFQFNATSAANLTYYYTFTYQVL